MKTLTYAQFAIKLKSLVAVKSNRITKKPVITIKRSYPYHFRNYLSIMESMGVLEPYAIVDSIEQCDVLDIQQTREDWLVTFKVYSGEYNCNLPADAKKFLHSFMATEIKKIYLTTIKEFNEYQIVAPKKQKSKKLTAVSN